MKKNVFKYGLISGLIISAFALASVAICDVIGNYNGSMLVGYTAQVLALSFVYVGVKNYRDTQNGGIISFGKALQLGLLISLVACTMYVVAWAIDYNFFIPDFMDKYSAHIIKEAQQSGKSAAYISAQVAQAAQMKDLYKNPIWFTLFTYLEIVPTGLIVSLIVALLLKKKAADEGQVATA
ncbi:DUF4199 domain-containing protein [uncultured Mucilaginibacter sp.]|uniref:DUF4199 domain-containing protein n=1 Tax=uncultured Mucilaginibacter sp. TaxID=797541 RepID=UPI0025D0B94A|nr:DUF4199 domain-containing protein [uncultured Mucilaginibacter sp.]